MINPKFKERVKEIRVKISEIPFFILIWGPGEGDTSIVRTKRLSLKKFLSDQFGEENIIFPEEEDEDFLKLGKDWGHYAKYFYEVVASDAIIILAESTGSLTEVSLYRDKIAGKEIIFVKKRQTEQEGFAAQAYLWLNIQSIESEEWETCVRVSRLCLQFLERKRIEKFKSQTAT